MLISASLSAQNTSETDFAKFLQAERGDASKLIEAYVSPAIKGFSYGMTNGWFNTGETHKKWGFDINVTMSAVFTPSSDQYFTPGTLGLQKTTLVPSNGQASTIFGPKGTTTYNSTYTPSGTNPITGLPYSAQTITFNGPEGLDLKGSIGVNAVPVPMVQVGLGLPLKGTDLKVRFIPSTKSGSTDISMLGFGILHNIKQHIPGLKLAPVDISVLVAYNSMKGVTSLVNTDKADSRPDSPDGAVTYKLNSWVLQGIVSKKLSVLTVYGALGYGSVSTNVDVTGSFLIPATPNSFSIKDPLAINISNTGIKGTFGLRLKLGPVTLNGDYTLQAYNALTLGLGVSIR